MRIGLVGVARIGVFHAATLRGLDCAAPGLHFPADMPYTNSMERSAQAYVDELEEVR